MSTPLLARILGSLQWVCPNCSWIYGSRKLNWRRPRVVCQRCATRWIMGIVAMKTPVAPCEAYRAVTPWRSGPLNVVAPDRAQEVVKAIGRFTGAIELRCPGCLQTSRSEIWPDFSEALCEHCGTSWYLAPIYYKLDVRSSHYGPSDWTPILNSGIENADVQPLQDPKDRAAAQAAGESQ